MSDFRAVTPVLQALLARDLAPGSLFLEWGSGFGVVAGVASMLGYEAYGIEVSPELLAESEDLASSFGLDVTFALGSFVPPGGEAFGDDTDVVTYAGMGGADAYATLDMGPDEFDVVFAFPWPGETETLLELFAAFAAPGALLVTYEGLEAVRVRRNAPSLP